MSNTLWVGGGGELRRLKDALKAHVERGTHFWVRGGGELLTAYEGRKWDAVLGSEVVRR